MCLYTAMMKPDIKIEIYAIKNAKMYIMDSKQQIVG